jgi:hypothetical protein
MLLARRPGYKLYTYSISWTSRHYQIKWYNGLDNKTMNQIKNIINKSDLANFICVPGGAVVVWGTLGALARDVQVSSSTHGTQPCILVQVP